MAALQRPLIRAEEIEDGDTIFVDSGSTTMQLLRYLNGHKNLTVITHSLGALSEAAKYEGLSVISLGGVYNNTTDSFVGLSTFESLSAMKIHNAFMGATGVSIESGMMNTTFLEGEIKRGVVQRATQVFLMADNSKLGKEAVISFCKLEDIFEREGIRVRFG